MDENDGGDAEYPEDYDGNDIEQQYENEFDESTQVCNSLRCFFPSCFIFCLISIRLSSQLEC